MARDFLRDAARDAAARGLREISCAAQEPIAMAGSAHGGRFLRRRLRPFQWKEFWRSGEDDEQVFRLVKFEAVDDAKAGAKRRGDESSTRGGAIK